jgi:hypothetical protein
MADSRHKPSARFSIRTKDVATRMPLADMIGQKDHTPVDITGFKVKHYPAKRAWTGSYTFARKGGMMGGSGGACRAVTGGNGIGVVPQAFIRQD